MAPVTGPPLPLLTNPLARSLTMAMWNTAQPANVDEASTTGLSQNFGGRLFHGTAMCVRSINTNGKRRTL